MRDIKFRGKRVDKNEWVFGDFIHGVGSKSGRVYILPLVVNLAYLPGCHPLDGYEVITETVGQQSGINEIYKDDFVEDTGGSIYLIDFRYGAWAAIHEPKTGSEREGEPKWDYLYDLNKFETLRILGNIHDNPELISHDKN